MMRLLLQAREHNVSKEFLLSRVWGYDSNAVENHVEVYIGFLQKISRYWLQYPNRSDPQTWVSSGGEQG